jgi:hypothetical protein
VSGCGGWKATTLALTPTLSPEERESKAALLVRSFNLLAFAALGSFAVKCVRRPGIIRLQKDGNLFSLSWGRGAG